jgi:(p)ppGpp synthase/HD superfamily hydrolase
VGFNGTIAVRATEGEHVEIKTTGISGAVLGRRFRDALVYAATAHAAQSRKGGSIPYVGHLLGVASILIDAGATEDEAIAGLLHDAVEDQGGEPRLADIAATFGQSVADIVSACSDASPSEGEEKAPWAQRKEKYREHLAECGNASVYLVSAADKLHNLRSMWSDHGRVGNELWMRFNASPRDCLNNYAELCAMYAGKPDDARRASLLSEMRELIQKLEATI